MKPIFADFNAMTESGHVRLNCRGSQEDLRAAQIHPGDWAWLSDSELIVGARVDTDPRYGVVGSPDWETLVHLDDEADRDPNRILVELRNLWQNSARSPAEERRLFQLLALLEYLSPVLVRSAFPPGYFALRRAGSLLLIGKPELALLEIEEARRIEPGRPNHDRLFLEILRRIDLPRARQEAQGLAASEDVTAGVLAECINVLATHADGLPDDEFDSVARVILEWVGRFERAPGRENVAASTLAQVLFNKGLLLLRLGQLDDARRDLELARVADPRDFEIQEATTLTTYGQTARDIAARVRARPIAA